MDEGGWGDRLVGLASDVRNVWHALALYAVAAVILGIAVSGWLSVLCLIVAIATLAFAAITGDHGVEEGPTARVGRPRTIAPYPVAEALDKNTSTIDEAVSPLDAILFKHLSTDQENVLGAYGEVSARYYVNLREAALVAAQLAILVEEFASFIRRSVHVDAFHILAVPRRGNVVLGLELARELGLSPMLVAETPKNGELLETNRMSGRVMVIDDVHTTPGILADTVSVVRSASGPRHTGYIVTHVFVLIERSEGNLCAEMSSPASGLEPAGVKCYAAYRMGDSEFAHLVERVRAS